MGKTLETFRGAAVCAGSGTQQISSMLGEANSSFCMTPRSVLLEDEKNISLHQFSSGRVTVFMQYPLYRTAKLRFPETSVS